ncbi:Chemotaxis protein CheA [Bremerella volcania]|uniref:Chemotaxis protein CheA n=1 Tax=Bremerella volcania TaxID=2527984 RepID=A0A518C5J3_9BACT|nr:chemotaxis protein CheA [Bremerella volcania]QDU74497.1 Chemotaxis protein CheA [Bremerella volcania]
MTTTVNPNDELLLAFIDESLHSIHGLADQITAYLHDPANADSINGVFRTVHSIKGNAGFFGLSVVKKFAHSVENTLDDIRNQKLSLTEDLNRALIDSFDRINRLLQEVEQNEIREELAPEDVSLLERITELSLESGGGCSGEEALLRELQGLAEEMSAAGFPESLRWSEKLAQLIGANEEEANSDESSAIEPKDVLKGRFEIAGEDVSPLVHSVAEAFIWPEDGSWSDERSGLVLDRLADFSMVCRLRGNSSDQQKIESAVKDFKVIYESPIGIDEGLLSVVWANVALVIERFHPEEEPVETTSASKEPSPEAAAPETPAAQQAKRARSIRVNENHLDRFLDDVSALFITCERLKDVQCRMAVSETIGELVEELRQINVTFSTQANELQKSVVSLRKVPVRGLLAKFPPMARKLASDFGKQIDVHIEGEEVEVDKSLIEDLDSPLTHMIRNVADHAIETPEERIKRGVGEAGNLWIKAETTRTHVVITIRDDGRGIDASRIRQKAIDKKILPVEQLQAMPDAEVIDLIFHPGFSTAEKITDVSGRGVGMDVVRTTIRDHDGEVHVESAVNQGTTFTIEIPIRQAVLVIEGLLVGVKEEQFVIPFENIREVMEIGSDEIKTCHGQPMTIVRGETVSVVSLAEQMELDSSGRWEEKSRHAAVQVASKQGSACLLVDRVIGKRKVVVNDLQNVLENCNRISGVAQLGGGHLSLVISVPEIVKSMTPSSVV